MTMSNLLRALTLVGVICAIQGLLEYRCDVLGCGAGESCDATSHACTNCATGNFGVPCTLAGACNPATTCVAANTITNAGAAANKCNSNADTKCICKEGYYGDKCQHQRVRATCVAGEPLKIYVAPYTKTSGNSIFVYFAKDPATFNGDLTTYNCKTNSPVSDVYQKTDLPLVGGGALGGCEAPILENNMPVYYVYLQQAHPYRTTADQIFKVICDPTTAVEISVQTVSQLDVGSPVDETSSAVAGILMKVRTEVTADEPKEIAQGAAVTIGTQLAITFEHQGPIMATVCKVTDGETGTTAQDLITASCVPQTAEALYWNAIQVSSPSDAADRGGTADYNMIKLRIRAFRFQGTAASMKVTCTICKDKACVGGGGAPICSADNTLTADMLGVYGDLPTTFRRRRDVTGSETQTNLTVALTVVDGQVVITNGNDGLSNGSTDVGNCYKSTSVLLPIILLAVLLLVAMVMTFFFCRRLTNELERKESETNMAYK